MLVTQYLVPRQILLLLQIITLETAEFIVKFRWAGWTICAQPWAGLRASAGLRPMGTFRNQPPGTVENPLMQHRDTFHRVPGMGSAQQGCIVRTVRGTEACPMAHLSAVSPSVKPSNAHTHLPTPEQLLQGPQPSLPGCVLGTMQIGGRGRFQFKSGSGGK